MKNEIKIRINNRIINNKTAKIKATKSSPHKTQTEARR